MPYLIEVLWVTSSFVIITFLIIRYIPKNRPREAWIVFLFYQAITWGIGTVILTCGFISSPVHPFPRALKAYFFDAYLFYPAIAVLYYFLCERARTRIHVLIMTITFAFLYTAWDYAETQLTNFKQYERWGTPIVLFLVSFVALYATRWFTRIFFHHSLKGRANIEK